MNEATPPFRAWLGLGGNIGDPIVSMGQALRALDQHADVSVIDVSPVYRTPPWGKLDQDWFFNACASLETALPPLGLLETCLDIERQMKRQRRERWGPRIIDIDVLVMQDLNGKPVLLDDERLQLPHPRMHLRGFVLAPLAAIAPDLTFQGETTAEWLSRTDVSDIETARTDAGWWKEN